MEKKLLKKETEKENLVKKNENEERNSLKKKNLLQRIEDIENLNYEKNRKIKFLMDSMEKLEQSLEQIHENENEEVEKIAEMVHCERGMNLY